MAAVAAIALLAQLLGPALGHSTSLLRFEARRPLPQPWPARRPPRAAPPRARPGPRRWRGARSAPPSRSPSSSRPGGHLELPLELVHLPLRGRGPAHRSDARQLLGGATTRGGGGALSPSADVRRVRARRSARSLTLDRAASAWRSASSSRRLSTSKPTQRSCFSRARARTTARRRFGAGFWRCLPLYFLLLTMAAAYLRLSCCAYLLPAYPNGIEALGPKGFRAIKACNSARSKLTPFRNFGAPQRANNETYAISRLTQRIQKVFLVPRALTSRFASSARHRWRRSRMGQ